MSIIEKAAERIEKGLLAESSNNIHQRSKSSQSRQNILDLSKFRKVSGAPSNEGKAQIDEEFRIIKRPLIKNAFNKGAGYIKHGNLIMVTSALAGEGKSFCAINLAISIAMEMDHTVLLVDADVARPSIPKYLGFTEHLGLLDILVDKNLDLADVIMRTSLEKLSILSAGNKNRQSTELLASQSMSNLLEDIAQRYSDRIVIFDSPPLLLTTESHVLATQMGQIVLVVEAESTPHNTVLEALRQIESCDVINLILNKSKSFDGTGHYGGYYT